MRQRMPCGVVADAHPKWRRCTSQATRRIPMPRLSAHVPQGMYGAIVSFEIKDAGREEVFRFMDALKLVVRATSLGDVHTMMLYP